MSINVKKMFFTTLKIIALLYIAIGVILYFFQEKMIFFPHTLEKGYSYNFNQDFEELNFQTSDNKTLNGLLFKAENSKGLVFYLHGNAGDLSGWGDIASIYTNLNYDIFILDYRGFGKSEGSIKSQAQLFEDNQLVYNQLKTRYSEGEIVVIGYSIGTGMASKLASENNPKMLILQAPYYSLTDLVQKKVPFIPSFILKYKLENYSYLKDCKMPIFLFHGDQDEIIYYESSVKLKQELQKSIQFITLKNQSHISVNYNLEYQNELKKILEDSLK